MIEWDYEAPVHDYQVMSYRNASSPRNTRASTGMAVGVTGAGLSGAVSGKEVPAEATPVSGGDNRSVMGSVSRFG